MRTFDYGFLRCLSLALWAVFSCAQILTAQWIYPEDLFPDLRRVLVTASAHSEALLIQEMEIVAREADIEVAESERHTRVDLNSRAFYGYVYRGDVEDEFRASGNLNLNVRKPLYHWGALEASVRERERRRDYEVVDYERFYRDHLNQVRESYLRWVGAQHQLRIYTESVSFAERSLENQQKLLEVGRTSTRDVLEIEARLYETRERLNLAERERQYFANRLEQLTGGKFDLASLSIPEMPEFEPMNDEELASFRSSLDRQNLGQTPEMLKAEAAKDIESAFYESLEHRRKPKLDLIAGVFTDRLDAVNDDDSTFRTQVFAGLQVNWNIFDGAATSALKRSSIARQRANSYRLSQTEKLIKTELDRLLDELQINIDQYRSRQTRAQILQRRVDLAERQEQQSMVTGLDRVEMQLRMLEINHRILEAKLNYLINLTRIAAVFTADPVAPDPAPAE